MYRSIQVYHDVDDANCGRLLDLPCDTFDKNEDDSVNATDYTKWADGNPDCPIRNAYWQQPQPPQVPADYCVFTNQLKRHSGRSACVNNHPAPGEVLDEVCEFTCTGDCCGGQCTVPVPQPSDPFYNCNCGGSYPACP